MTPQANSLAATMANPNAAWQNNVGGAQPNPAGSGGGAPGSSPADHFLATIQAQLQSQQGLISSSQQSTQDLYNGAINTLTEGNKSNTAAVNAQYDQLESQQKDKASQDIQGAEESQRGFATNTALLQQITKSSDEQLNALEENRQQLIMSGNAQAAKDISALQVQALQDRQKNMQDTFTNLLNLASFGQAQKKAEADQAAQQFTQDSTMATLAAKYGITIAPGETMASLENKIAPVATKEEQGAMALQTAQTAEAHANAYKAIADANSVNSKASTADLASVAKSVNLYGGINSPGGQALLASLKDAGDQATVIGLAADGAAQTTAQQYAASGMTKDQASSDIVNKVNKGDLTAADAKLITASLDSAYENVPTPPAPLPSNITFTQTNSPFSPSGLPQVNYNGAPASPATIAALNKALGGNFGLPNLGK